MKVLVACEYSGTVRDAFLARGHDAWSCDLLDDERNLFTKTPSNRHIKGDARHILDWGWDLLMVAHPPCTRLCNAGIRYYTTPPNGKTLDDMWAELDAAADLFSAFWSAPIDRIAIENPIMHRHAKARIRGYQPPAQTITPLQFGDDAQKKTSLWLKGLPTLAPTDNKPMQPRGFCVRKTGPRAGQRYNYYFHNGRDGHERSRFFPGVAAAMADQWGGYAISQLAA